MKKRLTLNEKRRLARENAMPEVKKLVRKYSRQTISGCLNQLREYESKVRQLELAKDAVSKLEAEL